MSGAKKAKAFAIIEGVMAIWVVNFKGFLGVVIIGILDFKDLLMIRGFKVLGVYFEAFEGLTPID